MSLELDGPLVLIGAGRMGGALLAGWLARGLSPSALFVRDPAPSEDVVRLVTERGIALNFEIEDLAARAPCVVVLAVKPQLMADIVPALRPLVGPETVFLSIAAGTSLANLKDHLGQEARAVRAMPNTPAALGKGMSVLCAGAGVSEGQKNLCGNLLGAVGETAWVDSEALIDAVTAVSGSGPAYVFYLAECLAVAGEAVGLSPALAAQLARATVAGAGAMLEGEVDAATLRQNVTSPGGTTAAALDVLMGEGGLSPLLRRAVGAARDRARELGK